MLIFRRSKLYYTASVIITLVGGRPVHDTATYKCDDTRHCIIKFWLPDDEHTVLETCRGMKLNYYKSIICALSWLTLWRLTTPIVAVPHHWPLNVAFYIFIQQIQVLNILNMVYTLRFFPLQNAVCFIILTYLVPVLFTIYIQYVLKFTKIIPAPKG